MSLHRDPFDIVLRDLLESRPDVLGSEGVSLLHQAGSDWNRHHHHHGRTKERFAQSNLVSDDQKGHVSAQVQDRHLINPWGISFGSKGPFWVSNNGTGTSTLYQVDPKTDVATIDPLVVKIAPPKGESGPASPTGTVFNNDPNGGFLVDGKPALFIFSTEDGTISGWNGGNVTTLEVDNSRNVAHGDDTVPPGTGFGAVYKSLTIGTEDSQTLLYAANFRHGTVDVFNSQWKQIMSLTDGSLPLGYAPFNTQVLDGHLFVTYAQQDAFKHDDVAGKGHGFVDEFDLDGKLIDRVASGGPLDSPWGLAIAPANFGKYAGDLLVGNFGDGTISAYNIGHGDQYMGKLPGIEGTPVTIGDLWALTPGNGANAGSTGEIYFTAGIKDEAKGLFGSLSPVAGTDYFMVSGVNTHSTFG